MQQKIVVGAMVLVPFGKRFVGGIVKELEDTKPEYETKEIIALWSNEALVDSIQLKFWEWMAAYYMCEMGEVMTAALPAGFRIDSEALLYVKEENYISEDEVEEQIMEVLSQHSFSVETLLTQIPNSLSRIKKLLESDVIGKQMVFKERFRPRTVTYLYPKENITAQEIASLSALQQHVLLRLIDISINEKITRKRLLEESGVTLSPVKTLGKKGYIIEKEERIFRNTLPFLEKLEPLRALSSLQEQKRKEVQEAFGKHPTVLLHGITSSGKTEIYAHLIQEQLEKGKTVLFLLPEIALATQLANRLAAYFGEQLLVYHSKYNDNERVEVWQKLQTGKPYVVIGARSAVFVPFTSLGLIIVDEEHEHSFKQEDPSPRYHGRDAAIYLAHLHVAKVLLGTATPSFESYYNVRQGKYGLVTILQRYQNITPPEIGIVNMAEATRKKQMKGIFTPQLLKGMTETLQRGKQVLLFQNRRGYAYFVKCEHCDTVPYCPHCDVSLSMHKHSSVLRCHYCDYTASFEKFICKECKHEKFKPVGMGTEQIEEQVAQYFPDYPVDRVDWDTTAGKYSFDKIISRFSKGKTRILVGTQLLAKGLDFANIGLVAVLNADLSLHFPNFRANEHSFQMLLQVSGRAGRSGEQGKVMIQTYQPKHEVLRWVQAADYEGFYEQQIVEREQFRYPPVYRMIRIRLKHKNQRNVEQAAYLLERELKEIFGVRVSGAHAPLVSRIKTYYIREIVIKLERRASYPKAKGLIKSAIKKFCAGKGMSSVRINCDADCY